MNSEEKEYMIWGMMIDKKRQDKGYGYQTVKKIINMAKATDEYDVPIVDYVKGKEAMEDLLRS